MFGMALYNITQTNFYSMHTVHNMQFHATVKNCIPQFSALDLTLYFQCEE